MISSSNPSDARGLDAMLIVYSLCLPKGCSACYARFISGCTISPRLQLRTSDHTQGRESSALTCFRCEASGPRSILRAEHQARPTVCADLGYGVLDTTMIETAA